MNDSPFAALGIAVPDILLPDASVDLSTWAVIACDQYTTEPGYWEEVDARVGETPSTLRMIVPEIYLEDGDVPARIAATRAAMERYLAEGILRHHANTLVYTRRVITSGATRRGLIAAIDLEAYDPGASSTAVVRASELTIPARLPARIDLRVGAPLESPHVLVLYDDPERTVEALLEGAVPTLTRLYATDLMMDGGSVEGFAIPGDGELAARVATAFAALDTRSRFGFLFAAGDGNHSLAAAHAVWNDAKRAGASETDARRYCLVELVNTHDAGLPMHPIHRVVIGANDAILEGLLAIDEARYHGFASRETMQEQFLREELNAHEIGYIGPVQSGVIVLPEGAGLPVACVDDVLGAIDGVRIEYVHGEEDALALAEREGGAAILLPALDRTQLFPTIATRGALPRKAFSLGEARDKRYYLECRDLR